MINKDVISKLICQSFLRANLEYTRMSGGMHLQTSGSESLFAFEVARSIYQANRLAHHRHSYVVLEAATTLIGEWTGVDTNTIFLDDTIRHGRFDMVVYDENDNLRGIIELKRHVSWSIFEKDIERLIFCLSHFGCSNTGSLDWVSIAGFDTGTRSPEDIKSAETLMLYKMHTIREKIYDKYSDLEISIDADAAIFDEYLDNRAKIPNVFSSGCLIISKK